jgi:hypothetical protein
MKVTYKNLSEVVSVTLRNRSGKLLDPLLNQNSVFSGIEKRWKEAKMWEQAIANMPWRASEAFDDFYRREEQQRVLLLCLGLTPGNSIRAEQGPEVINQIKQYAGEYGTQLAAIKLANLGLIDQYPHWPTP